MSEQAADQQDQAEQIGTDDEQAQHRPPAPTPAEHNAAIQQARFGGQLGRAW